MKQSKTGQVVLGLVASLALVACGPAQAEITAELSQEGPDGGAATRPLVDLEVQLLPFDRDQVFDSLTQAAPTPEPAIPEDILQAQAEVADAQRAWRETEDQWNTLRDTLQALNRTLEGLNRGEARYRAVFTEWQDLDRQYQQVERQVQGAFENFESLQAATIERVDSMRFIREDWADQAFMAMTRRMAYWQVVTTPGTIERLFFPDASGLKRRLMARVAVKAVTRRFHLSKERNAKDEKEAPRLAKIALDRLAGRPTFFSDGVTVADLSLATMAAPLVGAAD